MNLVFELMVKAGITTATKEMMSRIVSSWNNENLIAKKGMRHLNSSDGFIKYLTNHVSSVIKMRTIHSSESDVILNDIYYPLSVSNYISDFSIEETGRSIIKIDDSFVSFPDKFTNVIGVAGQGKSTILRKLFVQHLHHVDKLPLFIELRMTESNGVLSQMRKILDSLGVEVNDKFITELLESNMVVLFLDGFDEISHLNRKKLLEEITEINNKYEIKIITSSRPGTEICNTPNIRNLNVCKLQKDDVIGIIKKLSKNNPHLLSGCEDDLINKVRSEDKLSDVVVSPILATLLFICYPYMDSTPNNHVEFYSDIFNTLYLRHDRLKGYTREKKSKLTNSQAFDGFCAFSFISLQKKQISMKYLEMIENARVAIKNIMLEKPSEFSPEDLCDDFVDVTCLIQKDGYERYSFLHKSICEYHAAVFIKEMSDDVKDIFYSDVIENMISENIEMMNTISFLKNIDKLHFSKNITIPLMEKLGVDQWENPSEELVNKIIQNEIENSTFGLEKKGNKIRIRSAHFNTVDLWLMFYQDDLDGKTQSFSKIIFDTLLNLSMSNGFPEGTPTGENIKTSEILNEEMKSKIRDKVTEEMKKINIEMYKKNKAIIESTKENILSLLRIS